MAVPDKINCLKLLPSFKTATAFYDVVIAICAYNQLSIVGHDITTPHFGGKEQYLLIKQICIDNLAEDL